MSHPHNAYACFQVICLHSAVSIAQLSEELSATLAIQLTATLQDGCGHDISRDQNPAQRHLWLEAIKAAETVARLCSDGCDDLIAKLESMLMTAGELQLSIANLIVMPGFVLPHLSFAWQLQCKAARNTDACSILLLLSAHMRTLPQIQDAMHYSVQFAPHPSLHSLNQQSCTGDGQLQLAAAVALTRLMCQEKIANASAWKIMSGGLLNAQSQVRRTCISTDSLCIACQACVTRRSWTGYSLCPAELKNMHLT